MDEVPRHMAEQHTGREFEDEIYLMDYLLVVWKWKYLIVAGTFICAIAAGVISLWMPKVYRIETLIRPGVLEIRPDGKNVYIDSAANIKESIETGTFDEQVLKDIGELKENPRPKSLDLEVEIPKGSNAVTVSYDTSNVDLGLRTVSRLLEILKQRYDKRIEYFRNDYDVQIAAKKTQVAGAGAERKASEQHFKNIQRRIEELQGEARVVKKNTSALVEERDKFFSNKNTDRDILSALVYTNTIQQNMALEGEYKKEIQEHLTSRENQRVVTEKLTSQTKMLQEELKSLEFKMNRIQNIQIVHPPASNPHPIRPKTRLNVMLSAVVGLLAMTFLAFFLEYIQRYRREPEEKLVDEMEKGKLKVEGMMRP